MRSAGSPDSSSGMWAYGSTPVATFWTLAATAPDGINIARPGGPASIQSARIARANDGATVVYVAKKLKEALALEKLTL